MNFIFCLFAAAAIAGGAVSPAKSQQVYPTKPISIVVPFAPGGVTDVIARLYAQKISARLGAQVIVDNKVGAGGTIGSDFIARARPDGYTIGIFLDSNTIAPAVYAKLGSDPVKDFTPITLLAAGSHVIVTHPSLPVTNLHELIAYAMSKPGEGYASTGQGTAQHLGMEMIKAKAGFNLTHVPYKGGGQAINDLVAGQIKVGVLGLGPALPFIRSGQLKAIAVTGEKRAPILPNVATVSETIPGLTTLQWFGVVGPAGLSENVVQRLHQELVAVSKDSDVEQKLTAIGLETRTSASPSDMAKFIKEDLAKWPPLVKAAGIKPE